MATAPEELARLYDSIFEKSYCDGSVFVDLEEFHFGSPATTAWTVAGIVIEGGMVVGEDVNLTDIPPATSVVSAPSTASNPILISINAAAQLPLKLSPTNYLSWCAQFNALLIGARINSCCTPFLPHAILASVSEQVTPLLAAATTSHEAWTKLSKLYANRSRSRVMSLKDRLHKPRDSKPVSDYLQTIKTISDELALIDAPVLADDLVLCILNGIGEEFKDIVGPFILVTPTFPLRNSTTNLWTMKLSFNKRQSRVPLRRRPGQSPGQVYKGFCQLCDQQGHTAKWCPRARSLSSQDPIANCTTTNRSSPQNWLIDSAASHHVTSDLGNLSIHSEYDGHDDIIIGDGSVAKRLLRYLKGTIHHGLFLKRHATPFLHAYSDADWAGNHDDRTSTTAYIIYLCGNAISWSSCKQRFVSRSSTKAEYRALATTIVELLWLQSLLGELGVSITKSPVIYCDNVGATYVCANPVFHSRMKHIAIDSHFMHDLVSKGLLTVSHVATADQLADALTKPLSCQRLSLLRSKISVSDGSTILRGRVKDKDQNLSA
ncbi:hypothetical protein RHSIM_Rhsim10G0160500 [Rhododendron simsii]|uniref:Uncharacterized protein n=1 Tax=Rhododendron simsii TaxID=118357 RepID=A0A834GD63_RHOSS|nr:hypothetical protein RHSIM_Rhsim10G0160500 [Rhododendron simsii]